MTAVVFCAGLGTRLKPLTDTLPKALIPIAGKPLLQWQIEKLKAASIEDIIINVHHFPDLIIDFLNQNNNFGCRITISDERDRLLDTGGALKKILTTNPSPLTAHRSPLLACNVDILSNIDLNAFIGSYTTSPGPSGLLVVSQRSTQRYLCFDDQLNLVGWTNIATGEIKPSLLNASSPSLEKRVGERFTLFAFSGMQILSPETLTLLAQMPQDKFSLIDFYMSVCEEQIKNQKSQFPNLKAYIPSDFRMMDIGKIDHLAESEAFARSLISAE